MQKLIVYMVTVAVLASACVKEPSLSGDTDLISMTFSADTDPVTRTALHTDGKSVHWTTGDRISVFAVTSGIPSVPQTFSASGLNGGSAIFTGSTSASADSFVALYPYDATATYDGTTLTTTIPTVQTAVKGSFADDLNLMVASTSKAESHFIFQNLCALIKVTIPEAAADDDLSKISSIRIRSAQNLTGTVTYNASTGEVTASNRTVAIEAADNSALAVGTYYFTVCPTLADNTIYLSIRLTDGRVCTLIADTVRKFQLEGNVIYDLGTVKLKDSGFLVMDFLDYVCFNDQHNGSTTDDSGMITVSDGRAHIENTKRWSKVAWKYMAPVSGTYVPYVKFGTTKSGAKLYVDVDKVSDVTDLPKWFDSLTQTYLSNNGTGTATAGWNAMDEYLMTPVTFEKGTQYYVNLIFFQENAGDWVGNAHEVGFKEAEDIADPSEYVIYENDFNTGDSYSPFTAGWAWDPSYIKVENQYCEFYYNQAAYDEDPRRMRAGAELTCDYMTTTDGWYGFRIYLPEGKFPTDQNSIIAQIFNQGDNNCWAGHLTIDENKLVLSHRHALVDPTVGVVGTMEWNKWMPVVVYFKVGRNNKGNLKAWIGDNMTENAPAYDSGPCNFGFGDWIDDNTLNGEVTASNEIADAIGAKFGLYVTSGGDRTIRFDDVKLIEGNPTGAFDIVRPKN